MMNKIVLAALTLASVPALAGEKFVCNEYDRKTGAIGQKTIVLTQTAAGALKEGVAKGFSLEGYKGASTSPDMKLDGKVLTEDVMFNFTSDNKKVVMSIYLDEMDEASLHINGAKDGDYICR